MSRVSDLGEAKSSELYKKKNLISLGFEFDENDDQEGRWKNKEDEQLLEASQSH